MSLRPVLTIVLALALVLLCISVGVVYALEIVKTYREVKVPKAPGPCSQCRDVVLSVSVNYLENIVRWSTSLYPEFDCDYSSFKKAFENGKITIHCEDYRVPGLGVQVSVGLTVSYDPDVEVDLGNWLYSHFCDISLAGIVEFGDKPYCIVRDVAGLRGYVQADPGVEQVVEVCKNVWPSKYWDLIGHAYEGIIETYLDASAEPSSDFTGHVCIVGKCINVPGNLTLGPVTAGPVDLYIRYRHKEFLWLSEVTDWSRLWTTAPVKASLYYTLVLSVFAVAVLPNGSVLRLLRPVGDYNISVVAVDGDAFTRDEPKILHDVSAFYVYYIVPNKRFRVSIEPTTISLAIGNVTYRCSVQRSSIAIALPSDWSYTFRYVCYANLTKVRFVSKIANGTNLTVVANTTDVGKFVLDGGVYLFPQVRYYTPGTVHSVELLNVTVPVNESCVLILKPLRWDVYVCKVGDPLCSIDEYVFNKSLPVNTTFRVGSRGMLIVGIYNASLICNYTIINITSRPISGVQIYYTIKSGNKVLKAGNDTTPFTLVVPVNTTLILEAPSVVVQRGRVYSFVKWSGLVESTSKVVNFVVNESGTEIAVYSVTGPVASNNLCPIVIDTYLSSIWETSYSDSRVASAGASASVSRSCSCECGWVYVCDRYNSTTGECVSGHWECTGASISCSGNSRDGNSDHHSDELRSSSRTWTRYLLFGTLRHSDLEGSGWKICAGLWLEEASLKVMASASVSASASGTSSRSEHCGCSAETSESATASAVIGRLSVEYGIHGSGNVPIISSLYRSREHTFSIDKTVSADLESRASRESWSGTWSTVVNEYGRLDEYEVYSVEAGSYRKAMLTAVSSYDPSSSLSASASATASITSDPRDFPCSCGHCGSSCSCSASASASSTASASISTTLGIAGGRLVLRAGIANIRGWIPAKLGKLVCNDYACAWLGSRDPWSHIGTLSISYSPESPLPGQVVRITVTFSVHDGKQPVRLWIYKVVEHVWDPDRQRWIEKTYDLRLVTPWEISKAPRGKASITFTWKMPNGWLTVCARGWGIFTSITDRCWNIYPAVIIRDVKPMYVYYMLDRQEAYTVLSKYLLEQKNSVHAPDLYIVYGVVLDVRQHVCAPIKVEISSIDMDNIYYIHAKHGRIYSRHGSETLFNREICLDGGKWLLIVPSGRLVKIDDLPSNRAIVLNLGNATSILISRAALLGKTWTTYSVKVTLGQYYRFRRTIVLSLIRHVPVMVWDSDMPKMWILPKYVYDGQIVIGTWFSYVLRCSNYTISIIYSNYTLTRTRIPILNIELPPGAANNGPRTLQIDQRLLTGTCTLHVADLPTTSVETSLVVQSNYLSVEPSKTEVKLSSSLPIHHWTISVIVDGQLTKIETFQDKRSIVLHIRNYVKLPGHSIDVIVKAYPTCTGLCRPVEKTVIIVRR